MSFPKANKKSEQCDLRSRHLERRWEIAHNGVLGCVPQESVVIRSRRVPMSWSHLSPEQAERAEQIFQPLRQATEAGLRRLAALLACKEDSQLLGPTEFEVRERVQKIEAKAIETAVEPCGD